jgi:hypothetical protein
MNVRAISKAIAGALATVIVAWLARHDVIIDSPVVETAIEFIVAAGIGFVTVYLAPRNTPEITPEVKG